MTFPTYTVRVFFGTTPSASTLFTLNDATRGVLDNVTYLLGGDSGTDIGAYAVGITIDRGRPSQVFDDIDAGTCTVELNNETRRFDPLATSGPYYGFLKPGIRVDILCDGYMIFSGKVADWNLSYDVSGRSVASMTVEDGLATLARQQFNAWTATAAQTAGPRLTSILNRAEVAWSGGARALDTGFSTLQGDAVSWGSSVLNYCQQVAKSDGPASFFASRSNVLTFKDRRSNLTAAPVVYFSDGPSSTQVPFQNVGIQVGSETFYTRVSVTREGGTAQTYTTTTAQTDEVRSWSIAGTLQDSDAQALDMATYYATVFATGDARISEVTAVYNLPTPASLLAVLPPQINLLQLELNDLVNVSWTPNRVGSAISQTCVVAGIRHDIFPGLHTVSLKLSKYDTRAPFILDSATNGTLDAPGVLIF